MAGAAQTQTADRTDKTPRLHPPSSVHERVAYCSVWADYPLNQPGFGHDTELFFFFFPALVCKKQRWEGDWTAGQTPTGTDSFIVVVLLVKTARSPGCGPDRPQRGYNPRQETHRRKPCRRSRQERSVKVGGT